MSENELIEFKDRANFDFLRFRYAQDYEQRELKADCERVAQYARDTVKDFCLLGLRLKEMKAAEQWREVVDETGDSVFLRGFRRVLQIRVRLFANEGFKPCADSRVCASERR